MSPFAKIGPRRPASLGEIRGYASLHFAYQIFKTVLSIANRAHFCIVFEES